MAEMTYHGDPNRGHCFWVYPTTQPLINPRWDAYDPYHLCNNFVSLDASHTYGTRTYRCNGHQNQHHGCQVGSTPYAAHGQSGTGINSGVVALRSNANNLFVCVESAGNKPLIANRKTAGDWETFDLVVLYGDNVALKSRANGKYVCAKDSGLSSLIASSSEVGAYETFKIVNVGTGKMAFIAVNGKYVCAENNGKNELIANRSTPAAWETFDIIWK